MEYSIFVRVNGRYRGPGSCVFRTYIAIGDQRLHKLYKTSELFTPYNHLGQAQVNLRNKTKTSTCSDQVEFHMLSRLAELKST